jgi:hypothetical protein
MLSAENPQPANHRHLEPTTGSTVTADNVVPTQTIEAFAPFDERRERQNGWSKIPGTSFEDRAMRKSVVIDNTSQYHPSQTSGLPSSEAPRVLSTDQNNPSSYQPQLCHHPISQSLGNDPSLPLAIYHHPHRISTVTGQRTSFPNTPTQEQSKEASPTATKARSTLPLAPTTTLPFSGLMKRADSSSVTPSEEATTKTPPSDLAVYSPSPVDRFSPSSSIVLSQNVPLLVPGSYPGVQAEHDFRIHSSPSPTNGPGIQQTADSSFCKHVDCATTCRPAKFPGNMNLSSDGVEKDQLPMSKRDSLPLGLRNKRMQATDCLLFAATLLEEVGAAVAHAADPVLEVVDWAGVSSSIKEHASVMPPLTATTSIASDPPSRRHFLPSPNTTRTPSDTTRKPGVSSDRDLGFHKANGEVGGIPCIRTNSPAVQTFNDSSVVAHPKVVDVLCGRGGKVNKHPGNIIFRRVVAYNKPYYQSVHKRNRILVSQSIVQAIIKHGGRFLIMGQRGKKTWVPIDFKKAVQKTSQALREFQKDDDDSGSGKEKEDARELQLTIPHEFVKA